MLGLIWFQRSLYCANSFLQNGRPKRSDTGARRCFQEKWVIEPKKDLPCPFNLQGLVWPRVPTSPYFIKSRNDCRNRGAVLKLGWSCQVQTWEGEVQIHCLSLKQTYILLLSSNECVFNKVRKRGRKWCCGIKQKATLSRRLSQCCSMSAQDGSWFPGFILSLLYSFKTFSF